MTEMEVSAHDSRAGGRSGPRSSGEDLSINIAYRIKNEAWYLHKSYPTCIINRGRLGRITCKTHVSWITMTMVGMEPHDK